MDAAVASNTEWTGPFCPRGTMMFSHLLSFRIVLEIIAFLANGGELFEVTNLKKIDEKLLKLESAAWKALAVKLLPSARAAVCRSYQKLVMNDASR